MYGFLAQPSYHEDSPFDFGDFPTPLWEILLWVATCLTAILILVHLIIHAISPAFRFALSPQSILRISLLYLVFTIAVAGAGSVHFLRLRNARSFGAIHGRIPLHIRERAALSQ